LLKREDPTINVLTLPHSRTINANSSYGSFEGQNVFYTGYGSVRNPGSSVSVSLSSGQKNAYVSFYYKKIEAFTGDFDVIPDSITFRDPFALRPKNFVMNGCTYIGHKWLIDRDGQ